jgi:hypothetical protein
LLLGKLFGPLLVKITLLDFLFKFFDLLVFGNNFFGFDGFADLIVFPSLKFFTKEVFGDVKIDSVGRSLTVFVE